MFTTTATEQPSFAFLARTTNVIHVIWTILLFVGGALVLFYPGYAWYQIVIMSITIILWFPFGMKCPLTVWTRYFEKRAGIHDGDERNFMLKHLSNLFGRNFKSAYVSALVAAFYIASYFISIGALAGWWR